MDEKEPQVHDYVVETSVALYGADVASDEPALSSRRRSRRASGRVDPLLALLVALVLAGILGAAPGDQLAAGAIAGGEAPTHETTAASVWPPLVLRVAGRGRRLGGRSAGPRLSMAPPAQVRYR